MNIIKKTPLLMAGLALGLAALGNLLQGYGQGIRYTLGGIAAIIFIMLTSKILADFKGFMAELDNPIIASVFSTYPMAGMLLSVYLKPFAGSLAYILWLAFVILHALYIIYFTFKFVPNKNIKQVFPSWFIVYVGIVVASLSAGAFEQLAIGQIAFWFGFVSLMILIPFVLYRVFKVKEIPEPATPNLAILCAPTSLALAGYLNAFPEKNFGLLMFLVILGQLLYFYVIANLYKYMDRPFSPGFSAFTFPLVISAISLKGTVGFLGNAGYNINALSYLALFEEILAAVVVIYVLVKYVMFLYKLNTAPKTVPAVK